MRATTSTGSAIGSVLAVLTAANVLGHRVLPGSPAPVAAGQVAALAAIARAAGVTPAELGLDRRRLGAGLRWGGAAAAVVVAAGGVGSAVPAVRAAVPGAAVPGRLLAARVLVRIPATTVLPEEFAFRGVLTALLARRYGPGPARIAVAGLFGCWHVLPGLAGGGAANDAVDRMVGTGAGSRVGSALRAGGTVLVTTAGGLLLGELGRRSGSLLAPVLLHWAVNGCGELLAGRR